MHFALLCNRFYYSSKPLNVAQPSGFTYNSLWQHMKTFPGIRACFELHLRKKIYTPLGRSLKDNIDILERGKDISTKELYKSIHSIFAYSLFEGLYTLKRNIHTFSSRITKPLYFNIDKIEIDSSLTIDQLPFMDIANPLMYFYSKDQARKNLLMVFMTESNNLNMPFMLANEELKKYNMHICYIYNRNVDESLTIKQTINTFIENGLINNIYALTISSGCNRLIEKFVDLPIKKLINYSGGISNKVNTMKREQFFENLAKFSKKQNFEMMSIFSLNNSFDQNLYMNYSLHNVKTQFQFIDSDSHGTFSLAFQKDLLKQHMTWLESSA